MIIRGPFTLIWNGNTLEDIEALEFEYETNSDDYESNAGNVYEINKSIKASLKLTFLSTDIPSLAAVLPQYFKATGATLTNGDPVIDARGALEVLPDDCDTEPIYSDLSVIACAAPDESFKLLHCRTILDNIEVGKIRKIVVKFIGEPEAGKAVLHFLGDQGEDDFFMLGDPVGAGDELFLLGDGSNLIL